MMNTNRWLVALLLFILFDTSARTQSYIEPDSTIIARKNTLMLLVNPLAQVALNGSSHNLVTGIQYKRILKPNKRLKIGLGFEAIADPYNSYTAPIGAIVASSDTSVSLRIEDNLYHRFHTSGGLEWSDFAAKNGMFYGVDVQLGVRKEYQASYINHYLKAPSDSTLLNANYFATLPDSVDYDYDYTHSYFDIGFALNIGYRINIKEKWEINLTFSPQFNLYFATKSQWNLATPEPLWYLAQNGAELQVRMLMIDIGYRF